MCSICLLLPKELCGCMKASGQRVAELSGDARRHKKNNRKLGLQMELL
jgi:hypothetical protein